MTRGGKGRAGGPVRVGRVLEELLKARGLTTQIERTSVVEDWAGRVGPAIAAVTRARGLSDETLFVEVRSSAWLMELEMMKREILGRLNEGRGEVRVGKIVFVLADNA